MGWFEEGACRGHSLDLFFPPDLEDDDGCQGYTEEQLQAAYGEGKKVCASCPVRVECLDNALARKERYGLWGGTTPIERLRVERKKRRERLKRRRHNEAYMERQRELLSGSTLASELQ